MDLNSIKDQVSNLTLYDLKAGVRKVQNAVMNYTEMEAKVREATNNEPWGASSTIMQEIANGTHSYHLLNEIMPMIYKRFTEKAAEEWRQIYKALQLLEFLIKNGSERVIDDARSHLALLKMLRQFHFTDQNGKDQGLNVRNRSKELADLLGDVDRIRQERKKARANRNKFGGVEGGPTSGGMSSGSRYGGFGSEEAGYGGYSGGVYGDGGGFGGRESEFQDNSSRRDRFEEYDEGDDEGAPSRRRTDAPPSTARRETKKPEQPKPKESEVDFLSFDDDIPPETPPKEFVPNGKKLASTAFGNDIGSLQTNNNDDDDFDDFQSATPTTTASSKLPIHGLPLPQATNFTASAPVAPSQTTKFSSTASFPSISPAPSNASSIASPPAPNYNINFSATPAQPQAPRPQQPKPTSYQAATPNYFTSVPAPQAPQQSGIGSRPSVSSTPSFTSAATNKPAPAKSSGGGDAFGNLWSSASTSAGIKKTNTTSGAQGPNLASLQREKASQGLWGAAAIPSTTPLNGGYGQSTSTPQKSGGGSGLDDLLG